MDQKINFPSPNAIRTRCYHWLFPRDVNFVYLSCHFKVTRHLCFKNNKNLQPQDILAFNSANKPSFQHCLLAELQAWTSRSCKFLLFLKHRCLVTLSISGAVLPDACFRAMSSNVKPLLTLIKDVLRGISHFLSWLTYDTLISQLYGRLPLELTEYYLIISFS